MFLFQQEIHGAFVAMDSPSDLTKVRQSLDQVTLDFFDTLGLLYQRQAKLEELMRSGFFSLSRARYSMGGTRNVGALQFPQNEMEMEALSVVDVLADKELSDKKGDGDARASLEFKLVEKQMGTAKKLESKSVEKSDLLRQRKGQNISSKDKGDGNFETIGMQSLTDEAGKPDAKETSSLKDPLTLFGVLVSPHLRQCQASFKEAVAVAIEIANLKHTLQGLCQDFEQLMIQKKALMTSWRIMMVWWMNGAESDASRFGQAFFTVTFIDFCIIVLWLIYYLSVLVH